MNAENHADTVPNTVPKRRGRPPVHGAFRSLINLDGRTQLARALQSLRAELVTALGGSPSTQELLLVDRCTYMAARIHAWEAATLNGTEANSTDKDYLAWVNTLRLTLTSLGLQRRARPVESLRDYLAKRQAQSE
jgi:hypothetical protein